MTTAIPQNTPLYLTFPHIGRTYRVIGWEQHPDTTKWRPIILNNTGDSIGLGVALDSLGRGTWPVHYHDTPTPPTADTDTCNCYGIDHGNTCPERGPTPT